MQLIAQRDANRLELPRVRRRPLREGAQQLNEAEQHLPVAPPQLLPEICVRRGPSVSGARVNYQADGASADTHMLGICASA